jgi:hypothetical protein
MMDLRSIFRRASKPVGAFESLNVLAIVRLIRVQRLSPIISCPKANPRVPLVVTSTGITRQWSTFSESLDEVIDARVYSGIHFRHTDGVGARVGKKWPALFGPTHFGLVTRVVRTVSKRRATKVVRLPPSVH